MALLVIGTKPGTTQLLVRDTSTGSLSWKPGTPGQIAEANSYLTRDEQYNREYIRPVDNTDDGPTLVGGAGGTFYTPTPGAPPVSVATGRQIVTETVRTEQLATVKKMEAANLGTLETGFDLSLAQARAVVTQPELIRLGYSQKTIDDAVKRTTLTPEKITLETYTNYYFREKGRDGVSADMKSISAGPPSEERKRLEEHNELLRQATDAYSKKYGVQAYWESIGATAPGKMLDFIPTLSMVPYLGGALMMSRMGGKQILLAKGYKDAQPDVWDAAAFAAGAIMIGGNTLGSLVKYAGKHATVFDPKANIVDMGGILSPGVGVKIPANYQFTGAYTDIGGGRVAYEIVGGKGSGLVIGDISKSAELPFRTQPEAAAQNAGNIAEGKGGLIERVEWDKQYLANVIKEGTATYQITPRGAFMGGEGGGSYVSTTSGQVGKIYTPAETAAMARNLMNTAWWKDITDITKGGGSGRGTITTAPTTTAPSLLISPNGTVRVIEDISKLPTTTLTALDDSGFMIITGLNQPVQEVVAPVAAAAIYAEPEVSTPSAPTMPQILPMTATPGIDAGITPKATEKEKKKAVPVITPAVSDDPWAEETVSASEEKAPARTPSPDPWAEPAPVKVKQPAPAQTVPTVAPPSPYEPPPEQQKPPPEIKIPLPSTEEQKDKGIFTKADGAVAWKQGIGWWVFTSPYNRPQDRRFLLKKPQGATIMADAKSAIGTIQSIGGKAPINTKFDMGIMDVKITSAPKTPNRDAGRKAIKFTQDKDKSYGRARGRKVGPYYYRNGAVSARPLE